MQKDEPRELFARREQVRQRGGRERELGATRGHEIVFGDPSARERGQVLLLFQVAAGAGRLRRALHRLVERQVLKCVERVVVDEHLERSLRGQEVRDVFERRNEPAHWAGTHAPRQSEHFGHELLAHSSQTKAGGHGGIAGPQRCAQ